MKNKVLILFLLLLIACKKYNNEILGEWNVDSKYYKATYKVYEEEGELVAQALYYDDGTTQYKLAENPTKKMYLFKNLVKKDEVYIDALAGETKTRESNQFQIKLLHNDTLEVTTYIMRKPLKEKWVRKITNSIK